MNSDKLSVLEKLLTHITEQINSVLVEDEKAFESKRKAVLELLNARSLLQEAHGWELTHERDKNE